MNHKDVLSDMLQHFAFGLHRTIKDLPKEALQWQPDLEANNIAVTVWHICRALDLLKVKILEDLPDQKQLWYAKGWAAKTNYDPTGLGVAGFGNLAGYTLEQVKEVPILSAGESLEYFDQVYEALNCNSNRSLTTSCDQGEPLLYRSQVDGKDLYMVQWRESRC